jgi:cytosine/adenosine deaminase-related metal-dependent hydrolase
MPFTIATDGLSSNNSLNIFDELRAALMLHHLGPLEDLANLLIKSITQTPAEIFNLNSGEIAVGKDADFALVKLPDEIKNLKSIALQTILHTKEVEATYINGLSV